MRKIEQRLPDCAQPLQQTVTPLDKAALNTALTSAISIYFTLRKHESIIENSAAEQRCVDYLKLN